MYLALLAEGRGAAALHALELGVRQSEPPTKPKFCRSPVAFASVIHRPHALRDINMLITCKMQAFRFSLTLAYCSSAVKRQRNQEVHQVNLRHFAAMQSESSVSLELFTDVTSPNVSVRPLSPAATQHSPNKCLNVLFQTRLTAAEKLVTALKKSQVVPLHLPTTPPQHPYAGANLSVGPGRSESQVYPKVYPGPQSRCQCRAHAGPNYARDSGIAHR
jgi:hypothetical protein